MDFEVSEKAIARARKEFQRVLDSAVPPYELARQGHFTDEEETFIQQEVDRLLYEPELPNAGEAERRILKRLKEMSYASFWEKSEAAANWMVDDGENNGRARRTIGWLIAKAIAAAERWAEVLSSDPRNPGWYYIRHPLTFRMNRAEFVWLSELSNCANVCGDKNAKWFAQLLLDGPPEGVADFKLEVLFLLRKPEGSVDRLVHLKNIRGEVSRGIHVGGADVLDAILFSAPEKFRGWCLQRGNFNWGGNQTHLQMLHRDMGALNKGRLVDRIDSCGWHFLEDGVPGEKGYRVMKGIWFFDDCAITPEGQILRSDDKGIIWFEGKGYFLNHKGRENIFTHGRPKMKPGLTILNCGLDYTGWENKPSGETEVDHLRAFFREVCKRSYENLGGYDAHSLLGGFFSFSAAPEIFASRKIFPGQFIHGQTQSGKNKTLEWKVGIYGMDVSAGLSFQSSTAVGLLIEVENYSNLPVYVDEFGKGEIDPNKLAVLHNAANRQLQAKFNPEGGVQRVIKTSFVVSGERTCDDPAFRSRYFHVQAAAERRLADHQAWFDANKRHFFLLGRFILQNRAEFVQHTFYFLDEWMKNPVIKNNREKLVHGINYAAWLAVCAMLGSHRADEVAAYKQFAISYLQSAYDDVAGEVNINVFMDELIAGWKAGVIPKSCFKLKKVASLEHPPDLPGMGPWISYVLYFEPNSVIGHMQAHLARQGRHLPLRRNDIRDQLKVHPYFEWRTGKGKYLQVRFGSGKDYSNTRAWGIHLDLHPYGLQTDATREDYDKFLMDDSLGDPRKGPLFAIVQALIESETGGQS